MRDRIEAGLRLLYWPNTILLLGLVSAAWVETDLYRYCVPFLLLEGIVAYYLRADRPAIGLMGILCGLWGIFVGLRLGIGMLEGRNLFQGSAEGVYFFAMVYPTLGYALFIHRRQAGALALAFVCISFLLLCVSTDLPAVLDGARVDFLFHSNSIHSSVAAGLIFLAAITFLLHLPQATDWPRIVRMLAAVVSSLAALLCVLAILGARSKGVWLALGLTAPVVVLVLGLVTARRILLVPVFAAFASAVLVAVLFRHEIAHELAPNVEGAAAILAQTMDGVPLATAVHTAIQSGLVPFSFSERLMLWTNAILVWQSDLVLGLGVDWIVLWRDTTYADIGYTMMHNGFLEVGIRYGLVGLAFYGFSFAWGLYQAARSRREGLIGTPAFVLYLGATLFFLLTLVTNSNNRLAVGESFMLLSGAFGFFCYFLRREAAAGAHGAEVVEQAEASSPEMPVRTR